jgi:hypothetical protein
MSVVAVLPGPPPASPPKASRSCKHGSISVSGAGFYALDLQMALLAVGALDFFIYLRTEPDFVVADVTIWCICPRKGTISVLMRWPNYRRVSFSSF